jgi:hypothetical protein
MAKKQSGHVAVAEQLSEYEHLFRAREEYLRLRAA